MSNNIMKFELRIKSLFNLDEPFWTERNIKTSQELVEWFIKNPDEAIEKFKEFLLLIEFERIKDNG